MYLSFINFECVIQSRVRSTVRGGKYDRLQQTNFCLEYITESATTWWSILKHILWNVIRIFLSLLSSLLRQLDDKYLYHGQVTQKIQGFSLIYYVLLSLFEFRRYNKITTSGMWRRVDWQLDASLSEELSASIFSL